MENLITSLPTVCNVTRVKRITEIVSRDHLVHKGHFADGETTPVPRKFWGCLVLGQSGSCEDPLTTWNLESAANL